MAIQPIFDWVRGLVRGALQPDGDYFDNLRDSIESSAPVCTAC
jgi:hypothetical protein